jgi:chemotaxis protein CheD
MSSTHVIGIAECVVTNDPEAILVTYALGSCIAVVIHDPVSQIGGLLHLMLPDSDLDKAKAQNNPYLFADTGIPLLMNRALQYGADKKRLVVRLVGGAQVMDDGGMFNIGKHNQLSARKVLWEAGFPISAEELGGAVPRTVRLEVGTGRLWVRDGTAHPSLIGAL